MISGFYAALCSLFIIVLSVRIVRMRRKYQVGIGDGGEKVLARAIRVQANAVEYIPISLLLLFIAENNGANIWLLHIFGLSLLFGRLLHAYGLSRRGGVSFGRYWGIVITWLVMIGLSIQLIYDYLSASV